MHLAPAVQAQNEVVHFAVDKLVFLVIKRHAVGGDGEMYLLAELRFKLTPIGHDALHDIEVHQRFAAEQIHLEIAAVSAVLYQKIERTLTGFCAHQHPAAVEFSRLGKAVAAAQIAVMRHVEAHALYRGAFSVPHDRLGRRGVEAAHAPQLIYLGQHLVDIFT